MDFRNPESDKGNCRCRRHRSSAWGCAVPEIQARRRHGVVSFLKYRHGEGTENVCA
ncbi:PHD finger family protein [Corchorus olitorius]|uniref:PHD finger family protein n=1 Tax=Corchorus olitorius TaxID=93759 RepID=A0A1R3GNB8_9ROSI|nr:PHD finger family protein [Corchorus olitorius]